MKIDWKRKLTSRKFWLSLIGFVSMVLVFCHMDEGSIERVTSLIMAGADLIAYIISEGMVDAADSEKKEIGDEE